MHLDLGVDGITPRQLGGGEEGSTVAAPMPMRARIRSMRPVVTSVRSYAFGFV
ncbi:hypothetical protein [Halomarina oriensis]|uniref:hypothetical protein n=1 Tax=Halomarina oriensis TaxID=671145 RepID=UPI0018EEE103|nr:hypothetical protein [Halomarina oriensis]